MGTSSSRVGFTRWLEAEAGLQVDDSASEGIGGLAEVVRLNVSHDAGGDEVEVVEEVKGVGTDLQPGVLAEDWHFGQAEGFCKASIERFISRAIPRVSGHTRKLGNTCSRRKGRNGEVFRLGAGSDA